MDKLFNEEGMSIRDIATLFNVKETALKDRFFPKKGGQTPDLPRNYQQKAPIISDAYKTVINEAKRLYIAKNKDKQLPTKNSDLIRILFSGTFLADLTKTLGVTPVLNKAPSDAMHTIVARVINKNYNTSPRTVKRMYLDLKQKKELPKIWGETIELKIERALKAMKDQEEFKNAFEGTKVNKWMLESRDLATGEAKRDTQKRYLARLYETISYRFGEWKNADGIDISDEFALAKAYEDARKGLRKAPECSKPKPIPFNDWNDDLVAWAVNYIDWNQRVGTYQVRTAFNHLLEFNKPLRAKLSKLSNKKGVYTTSTYTSTFGVPADLKRFARPAQIEDLKKTPDHTQVKGMLNFLQGTKLRGDFFVSGAPKIGGGKVKLSKSQRVELERETMLLAIHLAVATGMRVGTGSQPRSGMRSMDFDDVREDHLLAVTKTTKKATQKKRIDPTDLSVIDRILRLKERLTALQIDVKDPDVKIINLGSTALNKRLRDAAVATGVARYEWGYGEYRKITAAAKAKKVPFLFEKGKDPRWGQKEYRIPLRSLEGHLMTENPDDPDLHMHLFRAYALRELVRKGVPFEFAVDMGSGWDDISTAKKYYLGRMSDKQRAQYRALVKESFEMFATATA